MKIHDYIGMLIVLVVLYWVYRMHKASSAAGEALAGLFGTAQAKAKRAALELQNSIYPTPSSTYSIARLENVESGAWTFPGVEFAEYLGDKYKLAPHKVDSIASYKDQKRYLTQIANLAGKTRSEIEKDYAAFSRRKISI